MDEKARAILSEYLKNISVFYTMVKEWLKDKSLFCEETDLNINEKASGEYTTKKLIIFKDTDHQIAEICPVGAWTIGANGRMDLIGDFDQQILIYLKTKKLTTIPSDEEPCDVPEDHHSAYYKGIRKAGWYWIEDRRLGKAHALSKELFLDLLAEVSDYEF